MFLDSLKCSGGTATITTSGWLISLHIHERLILWSCNIGREAAWRWQSSLALNGSGLDVKQRLKLPLVFFIVPQPRDPKRKACLNSSSRRVTENTETLRKVGLNMARSCSSLDPQNCVDHLTAAAEELHKHHNHCDTGHGQSCLYHIYILPKANSFKSILQLPSQPFCKVERWLLTTG